LNVQALRALIALAALAALAVTATAGEGGGKIFPYAYTIDDLPNGLRLVTVPTEFPDLVSVYIVVQAGSRNEVEPGKSGYAHLFEHLMFRGSENYTPADRDALLKDAGASSNAYTTDDRTVFHVDFSKDDFDTVMKLEADAFRRLKYEQSAYKTETLAVLGEYNKNSANPTSKLFETLRATAFARHTYAHTTMGFIKDIEDMPNQYDYSLQFYDRYYRPEYTTVVVVGDVTRDRALGAVKREFGDWKRGSYAPEIAAEPAQTAPREASVTWPSATLPWVAVGYRAPAYSDTDKDKAALDLLAAVAFGENSALYKKLVIADQKVDQFGVSFPDRRDPQLFTVLARVKDPKDVPAVRAEVLAAVERARREAPPAADLDAARSRLRYSFALSLDSSAAIAASLAEYVGLRRTPATIERVFDVYKTVTPDDVRAAAARWLVDNNRTIVTLESAPAAAGGAK
jgi:zinc protease